MTKIKVPGVARTTTLFSPQPAARRRLLLGAALAGALVKAHRDEGFIAFERPRAGLPRSPGGRSRGRQALLRGHFSIRLGAPTRASAGNPDDLPRPVSWRAQMAPNRPSPVVRPPQAPVIGKTVGRGAAYRVRTLNSPPSPPGSARRPGRRSPQHCLDCRSGDWIDARVKRSRTTSAWVPGRSEPWPGAL
jgi:hypothetical protein